MNRTICLLFAVGLLSSSYAQVETINWFPFQPKEDYSRSKINMKGWLDAPAGKHGYTQMTGDDLSFADGTPVKFWGVNIASERPFLPHPEAEQWADFIATYGINAVRFHKFTWDATDGSRSTVITNDKWDNFDYFCNQLKIKGIYYAWSHIYGHRVLAGDSSRVLAYSEVANTRFPWSHLNGTTSSLVNFAEDLQALNIELTVNMLNHRNAITGLRYADDPALAYVELQNEDNIFWSAIEETLKQTPTYRALLCHKFSDWLKAKYHSQTVLEKAWGKGVLPEGQSLERQNIYPQPNHGMFSSESEKAWKNKTLLPQHVVDKADFLFEEQTKFYNRFVRAIRETGYKGAIVASCWQAGSGLSHLLNLYSDYEAGIIDRHNYFGGGTGHRLEPGKVDNNAMVSRPGSGLLSTGFQQVRDRPFFVSEWMSLIPNEWTAESSPIIAAYGLGLQGWDGSFAFAMDYSHFTNTIESGHGVYNVTSPTQLALYPALAAMTYRNDISTGTVIADRKVSFTALQQGHLPFFEKVAQQYDVKSFEALAPLEALAAGRIVLSFTENNTPNAPVNLKPWVDSANKIIKSTTGQLKWYYKDKGYFSINSEGTQGVVGFAANQEILLNDFVLKTPNKFAVILASSMQKDIGIAKAKSVLITTVARARNTNMKYDESNEQLINEGEAPLLLEPVIADMIMKDAKGRKVYVLDHSGNRTHQLVPGKNGHFILDGNKYKTIYYELANE